MNQELSYMWRKLARRETLILKNTIKNTEGNRYFKEQKGTSKKIRISFN